MSGPLLFIAADPRECTYLVSQWRDVRAPRLPVHWARAGKWRGLEALAVANGAGAERAFAAVRAASDCSAVYNVGFCGALDDSLNIGDIFIATEIRDGAHIYKTCLPAGPRATSGALLSLNRVIGRASEKSNLRVTGASVVEMEAGGAARAADDLGVPFYCIRVVSDLAGEDFATDFNAALTPDGRFSVPRLLFGALRSPRMQFGELMRLRKHTAIASKNLGEFLAECDF